MNIILLGPPGVGKGTQAKNLEKKFFIPHISTGDLLRSVIQSNSSMGLALKKILEKGELVSDNFMSKIIQQRISTVDYHNGFILDGFPRTIGQGNILKDIGINIDYIVEITLDNDAIIKRLAGRYIHESSGRTYHISNNPSAITCRDDIVGEPLIQRSDDNPKIIKKRLSVYYSQTVPLVKYYQNFDTENGKFQKPDYIRINGSQSIHKITEEIIGQISL